MKTHSCRHNWFEIKDRMWIGHGEKCATGEKLHLTLYSGLGSRGKSNSG